MGLLVEKVNVRTARMKHVKVSDLDQDEMYIYNCLNRHIRFKDPSKLKAEQDKIASYRSTFEYKKSYRNYRAKNAKRLSTQNKIWRAINKPRCREASRAWCEKNRDKSNAIKRKWALANADKMKAARKRWESSERGACLKKASFRKRYRANPDKFLAVARAWKLKNRAHVIKYATEYQKRNPKMVKIWVANKRKKMAQDGRLEKSRVVAQANYIKNRAVRVQASRSRYTNNKETILVANRRRRAVKLYGDAAELFLKALDLKKVLI